MRLTLSDLLTVYDDTIREQTTCDAIQSILDYYSGIKWRTSLRQAMNLFGFNAEHDPPLKKNNLFN
jgi:hypothetical protein